MNDSLLMENQTDPQTVIIHVDLDCFYCQVEQLRLGIPFDVPFVVQQWGSLIAVNYPARAHGIKRFMLLSHALKICPTLRSAHTATIALGDTKALYHEKPMKSSHKVSLEPYRMASERIHGVLQRIAGSECSYERAGTDEAFIDVSYRVQKDALNCDGELASDAPEDWPSGFGVILNGDVSTEKASSPLYLAAKLCAEMRAGVRSELGYNCSAGISSSKTLSKLLSARFKPNNQATITPSGVEDFMRDLNIKDIRGFGGIFGGKVKVNLGVETCGDIWKLTKHTMLQKYDIRTIEYIVNASKGIDVEEAVRERPRAKSILAAKNFPPSKVVMPWVHVLVAELDQRVTHFVTKNSNYQAFKSDETKGTELKLIYPKTVTCVLKYIDVTKETEEAFDTALKQTETITKTFGFEVLPFDLLAEKTNVSTKRSSSVLLQSILSNVSVLLEDEIPSRYFWSLSISIHTFAEGCMSPSAFHTRASPHLKADTNRRLSSRNTTLDSFLKGEKKQKVDSIESFKSVRDASGREWIDLT